MINISSMTYHILNWIICLIGSVADWASKSYRSSNSVGPLAQVEIWFHMATRGTLKPILTNRVCKKPEATENFNVKKRAPKARENFLHFSYQSWVKLHDFRAYRNQKGIFIFLSFISVGPHFGRPLPCDRWTAGSVRPWIPGIPATFCSRFLGLALEISGKPGISRDSARIFETLQSRDQHFRDWWKPKL